MTNKIIMQQSKRTIQYIKYKIENFDDYFFHVKRKIEVKARKAMVEPI